jgi:hypothetical protein
VARALKISRAAAWRRVAVTPVLGVNDVTDEIFTLADAKELAAFAQAKHLAWLSLWSANRDSECPGGVQPSPSNTCSSILQAPYAFDRALSTY